MNYSREGYEPYINKGKIYAKISFDMDYAFEDHVSILEFYKEYIESILFYLSEKYGHKNNGKKTCFTGFKDIIFYNVETGKAKFLALELVCFFNSLIDFHKNILDRK